MPFHCIVEKTILLAGYLYNSAHRNKISTVWPPIYCRNYESQTRLNANEIKTKIKILKSTFLKQTRHLNKTRSIIETFCVDVYTDNTDYIYLPAFLVHLLCKLEWCKEN